MDQPSIKFPSAFVPMILSSAALAIVIGHIALYGVARDADEGTAAHLFQLLVAAEIPAMIYFVMRWFPRNPRRTVPLLGLQLLLLCAALSPVFFFRL